MNCSSVGRSDAEKNKRKRDVRRFLKWASDAYPVKALEILAKQITTVSPSTQARSRKVETLQTGALERCLAKPEQTAARLNWQAMVAVLAYGGLRLSELAGLKWCDVDFTERLLSVRDGMKVTKTESSNRVVHKLAGDFWPWLERLRVVTGSSSWVFPFISTKGQFKDRAWLQEINGKLRSDLLSRRLAAATAAALGREVPMRARRWCRTTAIANGVPLHLVDLEMGHDSSTGQAHYENARAIVLASVNGCVNGSERQSVTA